MRRLRLILSLCVVASIQLAAPAGDGRAASGTVTLLGQFPLPFGGAITDVWGYADTVAGKEYALVGTQIGIEGFFIIDVTTPTNPVQASQARFSIGFDVKVWDHYAYTVTGAAGAGGFIVDIANPFVPVPAGIAPVGTFESSHNIFIDDRGFLYLASAGLPRELRIYNLNPNPIVPAGPIFNDGILNGHDVSVVDTILYDFHGPAGTRIYGVSNPASPVLLGVINDPGIFHHSGYPTEDGRHLFICNELAKHPTADITVWNIENPAVPFKVAEIADTNATVHNLYVIGDFAYVSYYTSGFKVFDVSDPTQPVLADSFDTSALSGEGFQGAFGVYPFAPSGNIYVSDIDNGLYVFSFTPVITAVAFAAFDAVYENGGVRLSWSIASADGLEGYHVYRSRERDAGYQRLNPILVAAGSGTTWEDRSVEAGETWWYRVGAVDRDGEFLSPAESVTIPEPALTLQQNVPNPFNPSTSISYQIPVSGHVVLAIYDPLGRHVRTLVDGLRSTGAETVTWDGRDETGRPAASGVYFYKLTTDHRSRTRRMLLLK